MAYSKKRISATFCADFSFDSIGTSVIGGGLDAALTDGAVELKSAQKVAENALFRIGHRWA